MKKVIALVFILAASHTALAQRDALIDHTDKWNLNTRFDGSMTQLDGDNGLLGGVSVGGLLNDSFGLGLRGRALIDSVEGETIGTIESTDLWYGGAYIEYVTSRGENLVYFSFDVMAGLGEVDTRFDSSSMMVIEPGLAVWINIYETFMIGLGGSYRMVEDLDLAGADEGIFDEALWTLSLRFTQF